MSDFGQRLKQAIKNAGKTQTELADAIGIKQQSVQYLCSGKAQSSKHIVKIASFLETTPEWLEAGIKDDQLSVSEDSAVYEVIRAGLKPVPVFTLRDIEDNRTTPLFSIPCPVEHSHNTYGAKVHDNTMQASMGASYPEGSIIFVDPERAAEAQNGDLVVFRLSESGVVGFKRLVDNETVRGLEPLNIRYPMVPQQDFEVIGLVIGCWVNPPQTPSL
jgi:SOS-response transcriptional repressor LexA